MLPCRVSILGGSFKVNLCYGDRSYRAVLFLFFPLIFTQLPLPYYLLLYICSCCFCLPFKFCCYASAKTQGKCLYSGNRCLRLQHLLHSTHWLTPCMMCSTAVHQYFLLGTVPFHSTLNSSYLCRCQNLHGLKI